MTRPHDRGHGSRPRTHRGQGVRAGRTGCVLALCLLLAAWAGGERVRAAPAQSKGNRRAGKPTPEKPRKTKEKAEKSKLDTAAEAVEAQKKEAVGSLSRLAAAAESAGNVPGAIEATRKLRELEPTQVNHLSRLLSLYQRAGMARQRIEVYRELLELKPKNVTYTVGLASALYRIGDKKEAEALWSSLLAGADIPVTTFRSVLSSYRGEELYEQALAVATEGLKHYEDDFSLLYGKGLALEMLSRNEEAIEAYEKARKETRSPASVDAKLNRLYVVVGVRGEALRRRRQAADAAIEKLAELNRALGDVLIKEGKIGEGTAAYRQALSLTSSRELRAALEAALVLARQKESER